MGEVWVVQQTSDRQIDKELVVSDCAYTVLTVVRGCARDLTST